MPLSDSERAKLYRERKREAERLEEQSEPAPPGRSGSQTSPIRTVEQARAAAQALSEEMTARFPDRTDEDGRAERAARHARWLQEQRRPPEGASEQEIRDFYGYSASETRSKAERDAAAARMLAYGR